MRRCQRREACAGYLLGLVLVLLSLFALFQHLHTQGAEDGRGEPLSHMHTGANVDRRVPDMPMIDINECHECMLVLNHAARSGGSIFHTWFPKFSQLWPAPIIATGTKNKWNNRCLKQAKNMPGQMSFKCEKVQRTYGDVSSIDFSTLEADYWPKYQFFSFEYMQRKFKMHIDGYGVDGKAEWWPSNADALIPLFTSRTPLLITHVREPVSHVHSMMEHAYRRYVRESSMLNNQREIYDSEHWVDAVLTQKINSKTRITYAYLNNRIPFTNTLTRLVFNFHMETYSAEQYKHMRAALGGKLYFALMVTDRFEASFCVILFQVHKYRKDCVQELQEFERARGHSPGPRLLTFTETDDALIRNRTQVDRKVFHVSVFVWLCCAVLCVVLYFPFMSCRGVFAYIHHHLPPSISLDSQVYDFGVDIVNKRIEYVEKETGESLDLLSEEEIARIKKKKEEDGVLGWFERMWTGW
jgi:hypothetical protein